MKASDTDHRTNGEAADATSGGKFVHGFSENPGTGEALVALCGGKGAGLIRMRQLGLPVPEGFVITTEACAGYLRSGKLPERLMGQVMDHLARLEEATGRVFGDTENPLLVSVRSGAPVSMPGMMDTVLNLGLNDSTVHRLARSTGDERFAQDSHRRFIQAFGEIALERHPKRQAGDLLWRPALAQVLPGGSLYGPLAARRGEDRGARRATDAAGAGIGGARIPRLGRGERQDRARPWPRGRGAVGPGAGSSTSCLLGRPERRGWGAKSGVGLSDERFGGSGADG